MASSGLVTGIVGTRIVVVTLHRGAQADSLNAQVCYRAGIPVLALVAVQGCMLAACFSGAKVRGTFIAIVTEVDEIPALGCGFIDIVVAIVIHPVANLSDRGQGIAGR